MKKNIISAIILLIIIIILHFSSVAFGWYQAGIGIDSVQHFIAGIMFCLLWLYLVQKNEKNQKTPEYLKKSAIFHISMLGFVTLGAVIWEIWEFLATETAPNFAENFYFYSPTIGELLKDIICSQVAAILVSLILIIKPEVKVPTKKS